MIRRFQLGARLLGKFGHAEHKFFDARPECLPELFGRVAGIFHDIVQQPGGERFCIGAQVAENVGDGQRVCDIWLARTARLPRVLFFGHLVRALHQFDARWRQIV